MNEQRLSKKTKRESFLIDAVDLMRLAIIFLVLVYTIPAFVLRPETVSGRSMMPTLQDGDKGMINVFASLAFGLNRFDVVAVVEPESGEQWVKRVIGLPGERVKYQDGVLYINGEVMDEPFLNEEFITSSGYTMQTFSRDVAEVTLADNEYFLVGDNRQESYDSRARGPFHRSDIIGKHFYGFWPSIKVVLNDD